MKRVLGITLALLFMGFVPAVEAEAVSNQNSTVTAAGNSAPQWQRKMLTGQASKEVTRMGTAKVLVA